MKKIIFSGGGVKGFVYIGIIQQLQNKKYSFDEFHGCSIGSFFLLMYLLNISPKEMLKYSKHICLNLKLGMTIKNFLSPPFAIFSNKILKDAIVFFLNQKGFSEQLDFSTLYNATKKSLFVYASDISCDNSSYNFSDNSCKKCFNLIDTPHFKVVDAILASCAIPGFFPGITTQGPESPNLYVDGFLAHNFPYIPIEDFSKDLDISFFCKWKTTSNYSNNIFSYFLKCLKSMKQNDTTGANIIILDNSIEKEIIECFKKTGKIHYKSVLKMIKCGLEFGFNLENIILNTPSNGNG